MRISKWKMRVSKWKMRVLIIYNNWRKRKNSHFEMKKSETFDRAFFLSETQMTMQWRDEDNYHVEIWSLKQNHMLIQILSQFEFERDCLQNVSIENLLILKVFQRDDVIEVILYDSNTQSIIYACKFVKEFVDIKIAILFSNNQMIVKFHDSVKKSTKQIHHFRDIVYLLTFSLDNNVLISTSFENILMLWNSNIQQSHIMKRWINYFDCSIFSFDDKHIVYSQRFFEIVQCKTRTRNSIV